MNINIISLRECCSLGMGDDVGFIDAVVNINLISMRECCSLGMDVGVGDGITVELGEVDSARLGHQAD